MRIHQITVAPLVLALSITACLGQKWQADSLVGLWQTETNRWSAPGRTNKVEAVETIEFLSDHSFKITEVTVLDGKRWTNVPYIGTYTVLSTNRARLNFVPQNVPPGATSPSHAVSCFIVGDELEIPKLIASVVPEYRKYHRVK
ncbi:MAG TPA: hypothetical protein VG167_04265 [Verrucomicrobiae bacterium]|nr:hypothetical protein [Verrucomicrobiae bacterium]